MSATLSDYLAARDVPCPGCRYNLRDLKGECCPECGQAIELRVGLVEPRLGLWLVGLLPLTLGAGFYLFICIFAAWSLMRGDGGPAGRQWGVLCACLLVFGVAVCVWLAVRRRLRRWPRGVRIGLTVGAWIMAVLGVLAMGLLFN